MTEGGWGRKIKILLLGCAGKGNARSKTRHLFAKIEIRRKETILNINDIFSGMIILVSLVTIIRCFRLSYQVYRAWIFQSSLVLIVTVILRFFAPDVAGFVGATLWFLLIMTPSLLMQYAHRLTLKQNYKGAYFIARAISLIIPEKNTRVGAEMLQAEVYLQTGLPEQALEIFKKYSDPSTYSGRSAIVGVFRSQNQWAEMEQWTESILEKEDVQKDPALVTYHLRALGETGKFALLLQTYHRFKALLAKTNPATFKNYSRMYIFSFTGRKEELEKMFQGPLLELPSAYKQFWLATAEFALGHDQVARTMLEGIKDKVDPFVRAGVEKRLSSPPAAAANTIGSDTRQLIDDMVKEMEQEKKYGIGPTVGMKNAPITKILVGLILMVFIAEEYFGGSTNSGVLYFLGAFVPETVLAGQWWRVLASLFLHYGYIHLIFNLVALMIFGPFLEKSLGKIKYLLVYFVSGILGMMVILPLTMWNMVDSYMAIGASGCIMGVVGATAAIQLKGWLSEKALTAYNRLIPLLSIVVLQAAFDLFYLKGSFLIHLSGALVGFLITPILTAKIFSLKRRT